MIRGDSSTGDMANGQVGTPQVGGVSPLELFFNPSPPRVMHIDLNSCFASVEQQANPLLRDKPIAVVHSDAPYGCILAPSIEAKLWGVKTGMTLSEGKALCPWLIQRVADPPKYRQIHSQFAQLLAHFSPHVISKSIDEFVLTLPAIERTVPNRNSRVQIEKGKWSTSSAYALEKWLQKQSILGAQHEGTVLTGISKEIKSRIKSEIGDYLRVSIGVSTNQILAKLASGLHKPDGFDLIDQTNYAEIYGRIKLQDFCGINTRNEARLHRVGIATPTQFYRADLQTLKQAFQSILGRYWYTRLRGYEVDDIEFARQSFGQSYVLPRPMSESEWRPILAKLIAKAARRMRSSGYYADGVHLALRFGDGTHWHTGRRTKEHIYDDFTLLTATLNLLPKSMLSKQVKKIAFTGYGLSKDTGQLSCLRDAFKQKELVRSLDTLNDKWGEYSVTYGSMMGSAAHVRDAIAFGK